MKNKKHTFYIIPGWGEKITKRSYREIIAAVRSTYVVVPIKYTSKKGVLFSHNLEQVKAQIKGSTKSDVIFGFSVGALLAYQLASEKKFKKALIASPSAILEKDILQYPKAELDKLFTSDEIEDMRKNAYGKPKSPIVFFFGTKETKELIHRVTELHGRFGGIVVSIGGNDHFLSKRYLSEISMHALND